MTAKEQLAAQIKAIEDIVHHLRGLLRKYSRDFVNFRLDEIAAETLMDHSLKEAIHKALDDPDKEFKVEFNLKKP